jgi:succinate-semialdehyde dehydrogenase/glutarate-semialdehyde dehydrogenase
LPRQGEEVIYGASFVEWFAEEAKRVAGDVMASTWSDKRMVVLRQPIGVCRNHALEFPIAMITRKVAPAVAAGCSIVIKPAEQTPLSALAIAELAHRAGIPAGIINIITADAEQSVAVGKVLCDSPVVRHLSFTGSTPVGRILMRQSAPTVKKLALELGGHARLSYSRMLTLMLLSKAPCYPEFRSSGQTCVCTNRFYAHASVYDEFVSKLAAGAKNQSR